MGRRRRARRQQSGAADDFVDLVLHASGRWPEVGLALGGAFGLVAIYLIWGNPKAAMGLAPLFGFVLGLLSMACLVVGGIAMAKQKMAGRTATERLAGVWRLEDVQALTWQQFERLVADLFRRQGYVVAERGREAMAAGTGDGGVDLVFRDPKAPGAEFLVQCKQYKVWDVGEPKVREFYGAMAAWRTRCEGFIITCGRFSQPAQAFAAGKPIRLIDGEQLLRMLNKVNAVTPNVQIASAVELPPTITTPAAPAQPAYSGSPVCPRCRMPMVRRVAGRGERKGMPFWGCTNYPTCKTIINIAQ